MSTVRRVVLGRIPVDRPVPSDFSLVSDDAISGLGPDQVRVVWVRSPGSPDAPGVREAWQLRANEWGDAAAKIRG